MAEYNPSKIIKDGNTYNFRDTTKIPLSGSNQISGSLIPATDNSIDIGSSTNNIKMLYTKGITINGTQFLPSDYAQVSHTHTTTDITDFPTIPSKTSDLTNDSGFLTSEIDSSGTDWVRFKSGLQICWGQSRLSDSVCNWNFPKTFLKNPGVTATIYYTGVNVNAYQRCIEINLITITGASFRSANHMFGSNSYIAGTDQFNAIAIGRWK